MALRAFSSLLLACALGAGVGCDATVDPLVIGSLCPTHPIRVPSQYADTQPGDRMISDFEAGMTSSSPPTALLNPVAGRDGSWVVGAADKSITYGSERSSDCAARGNYAGHFRADNLTSWGINWTAVFHPAIVISATTSEAVPYDGRAYGGVSLWAAFSPNTGDPEVRIGISTMDTAYNGPICVEPNCADHYLTTIAPTTEWKLIHKRFADMKQIGYGDPQVPIMRKDQMVGFVIWPTQAFDLWIDDIRFEP
jgi:hypothetical protein